MERYHYFPASVRMWDAKGVSLLEQGRDESAANGMLGRCLHALRAIHASFFAALSSAPSSLPLASADVRQHVRRMRADILVGCHLIFTRCWHLDYKQPCTHPLWQMAEALGADCSSHYDRDLTTHVIAGADHTDKARVAREHGKHVVGTEWLRACFFTWSRAPEAAFPPPAPSEPGQGGGSSRGPRMHHSATDDVQLALRAAGEGSGGGVQQQQQDNLNGNDAVGQQSAMET